MEMVRVMKDKAKVEAKNQLRDKEKMKKRKSRKYKRIKNRKKLWIFVFHRHLMILNKDW